MLRPYHKTPSISNPITAVENAESTVVAEEGGETATFNLSEQLASFQAWDSLAFNDRLYSEDENQQRDGNYLVDVSLDPKGTRVTGHQILLDARLTEITVHLSSTHESCCQETPFLTNIVELPSNLSTEHLRL